MQITVKGRGMSVSDGLKDHLEEKLAKVAKIIGKVDHVEVLLIKQAIKGTEETHKAEITIHSGHNVLRAEETTVNMYASIDIATTKLERQARRLKERRVRKGRVEKGSKMVAQPKARALAGESALPAVPRVVRTKQFALKPMAVEDAALQLEMIGHDFFMFTNADTLKTNGIYKRKDGQLGLLESN